MVVHGGSGFGAEVSAITVDSSGRITSVTFRYAGREYKAGDKITFTQGTSQAEYTLQSADVSGSGIQNLTGKTIQGKERVGYARFAFVIQEPGSGVVWPTPKAVAGTSGAIQGNVNYQASWTSTGSFFTELELQVDTSTNPNVHSWGGLPRPGCVGQPVHVHGAADGQLPLAGTPYWHRGHRGCLVILYDV